MWRFVVNVSNVSNVAYASPVYLRFEVSYLRLQGDFIGAQAQEFLAYPGHEDAARGRPFEGCPVEYLLRAAAQRGVRFFQRVAPLFLL